MNSLTLPSLLRDCAAMSLRGSEATEAISKGIENREIAALLRSLAMTKRDYDTVSEERGERQGVVIVEII